MFYYFYDKKIESLDIFVYYIKLVSTIYVCQYAFNVL
jgi:hypothetical protein